MLCKRPSTACWRFHSVLALAVGLLLLGHGGVCVGGGGGGGGGGAPAADSRRAPPGARGCVWRALRACVWFSSACDGAVARIVGRGAAVQCCRIAVVGFRQKHAPPDPFNHEEIHAFFAAPEVVDPKAHTHTHTLHTHTHARECARLHTNTFANILLVLSFILAAEPCSRNKRQPFQRCTEPSAWRS